MIAWLLKSRIPAFGWLYLSILTLKFSMIVITLLTKKIFGERALKSKRHGLQLFLLAILGALGLSIGIVSLLTKALAGDPIGQFDGSSWLNLDYVGIYVGITLVVYGIFLLTAILVVNA